MSNSIKHTNLLTEILDAAFDKEWDVYSPEEYKRQIKETQADIRELTPEQEIKKMNKRMNLRVQATAFIEKIIRTARQRKQDIFKRFAMLATILQITLICRKLPTLHPHTSVPLRNIGRKQTWFFISYRHSG